MASTADNAAPAKPYTPKGRWYFSKEVLASTPSIKAGLPVTKELSYRQQAANFIQDMGQHLRV
jgi:cyclin T